jgi:hypothetical protein
MTERAKGHPLILSLLVGLVLLIPVAAAVLLVPTRKCPYCEGLGLEEEPSDPNRWVRQADLLPRVCDCCGDRGKVGRFKGCQEKWKWGPQAPVHRRKHAETFGEIRRFRIERVRLNATEGVEGEPPSGISHRPDLIPILAAALQDEEPAVRRNAALGLAGMNHEQALPAMIGALKQPGCDEVETLSRGIQWLARSPAQRPVVIAAMRELLELQPQAPFTARFYLTTVLMELGEPCNSDVFIEGLNKWSRISEISTKAVVRFDRKDAILMLIKTMAGRPPLYMEDYGEALSQLTGENFGKDPTAWYRWFEKNKDRFPPQIE